MSVGLGAVGRITRAGLGTHPVRLLATFVSVLLGVAFIAGTLVLTDTITRDLDNVFRTANPGDAFVRSTAALETSGGTTRSRVDAGLAMRVRAVEGVVATQPVIEGDAQIVRPGGGDVLGGGNSSSSIGGIWSDIADLNAYTLVEGRGPAADDEVVIDAASAAETGRVPGDPLTIITAEGPSSFVVVGVARLGNGGDRVDGTTYVGMTATTAQRLLAEPGRVDAIAVLAADGVTPDEVVDRVDEALGLAGLDGVEAITADERAREQAGELQELIDQLGTALAAFAVVALLAGAFIIHNTFAISVAQRQRELALLRAVGASRAQLLVSVLIESVLVGLIASAVGLAAGLGLAVVLGELVGAVGVDVALSAPVVERTTVLVALAAGAGVTVASAAGPAWRGTRVAPVAALREVAVDRQGTSLWRSRLGFALAVVSSVSLGTGLGEDRVQLVGFGAIVGFLAVVVLGPVLARAAAEALGAVLGRFRRVAGSLAGQNAARNPRRTSSTAMALTLGVTLVAFATVFAASVRSTVADVTERAFTGDLVVVSGDQTGLGGFSPQLAADIAAQPEVGPTTGVRFLNADIAGQPTFMVSVDPGAALELFDLGTTVGDVAALDADGLAVHVDIATADGLAVDDEVEVSFPATGDHVFEVGLVYEDATLAGNFFVGHAAHAANVETAFDNTIYVGLADGVEVAEGIAVVERQATAYPQADVLDRTGFVDDQARQINQVLGLVYALLAFAVVIALFGIANTITLSIAERTRELGLLRAVGMTRPQLRAAIRYESVIIAVCGSLAGTALGVGAGTAVVGTLDQFRVAAPVAAIAAITVVAVVAGVAVAARPAARAGRLDILTAIATE